MKFINSLTNNTMKMYNEYAEWLNDWMNFEDHSVGIYCTGELNKNNIDDVIDCFPENKLIYWNKDTLIMKDSKYYISIKLVEFGGDSKWIIAEIY